MKSKLLDLHFAQLAEAWQESQYNRYSDAKKEDYHKKLRQIFEQLKYKDFSSLGPTEVEETKIIIDFFFNSLRFLDGSTLNFIPFELVKCLEYALDDWVNESDKYIIVTSLVNVTYGFSFDPKLINDKGVYELIETNFGIEFPNKLIQINIPKSLSHDYLAGTILYHELGHFIDYIYQFSFALRDELINEIETGGIQKEPTKWDALTNFFPFLLVYEESEEKKDVYRGMLQSYISEYFCDLFASQYVGLGPNYLLDYIMGQNSFRGNKRHPASAKRMDLVNDFISGEQNSLVDLFQEKIQLLTSRELVIRYESFDADDFINLVPATVENNNQLHYLFAYGWKVWLERRQEIQKKNKMGFELSSRRTYEIINNLVEKSIGNYILEKNWKELE